MSAPTHTLKEVVLPMTAYRCIKTLLVKNQNMEFFGSISFYKAKWWYIEPVPFPVTVATRAITFAARGFLQPSGGADMIIQQFNISCETITLIWTKHLVKT